MLELPSSALGKLAKCPACDHTFRIGEGLSTPEPTSAPPTPPASAPQPPASPPSFPSAGTVQNPGGSETSANPGQGADASQPNEGQTANETHASQTPPEEQSEQQSPPAYPSTPPSSPSTPPAGATNQDVNAANPPTPVGPANSNPPNPAYSTPNPNFGTAAAGVGNAGMANAGPVDPNANPFSSPLESGLAGTPELNPYQPSYNPITAAPAGEIVVVPRTVEEVVSATIAIFGSRWGLLLVAFLLVMVVSFSVFVFPFFLFAAIADAGGDAVAAIGMLIGFPLMFLFSAYISVGLARNAIAVARNSPSPLMELLPPLGIVVRFIVGGVVMSLAAVVVFGLFAGVAAALGAASGNEGLVAAIVGIGLIFGVAAGFVVYWLLWSWLFAVSDGRTTAFGSIRLAYEITMANKLTSVLLLVIATVLSTAGTTLCYVGLLITQPLTNLMFATAYLLMTNQPIDDPRMHRAAGYPGAPQGYPPQPGGYMDPNTAAGTTPPETRNDPSNHPHQG